jgi:hypothetical protein
MTTGRPGQPKLDDPAWIALLERYVRGETAAGLAREYGVSVEAVAWQARNRGYRKMDRPDAVYRWRSAPPVTPLADAAERCGFDYAPEDLDGSIARAEVPAKRAGTEGRMLDFVRIERAVEGLRKKKERGVGVSPLHPPSPFGLRTIPLPHEGEEMMITADGAAPSTPRPMAGRSPCPSRGDGEVS